MLRVSKRSIGILALISMCLLVSGCWDRRELQDRGFVLAAAIDVEDAGLKPGQSKSVREVEDFAQAHGKKKYRLSLQILRFAGSEAGGGGGQPKTYVISTTGQSMHEMIRDLLGQTSKPVFFEHMQTIIVSEAVLRQTRLSNILDLFRRDGEIRWRIRVYATSKEARPFLEYNPPSGDPGGIYLARLAYNHPKNTHIIGSKTDLGYISQTIDNKDDVRIPRIEMADKVVKLGGATMFKKDRFVGYMDDYGTKGIKLIYGTEKSALIPVACKDHPGNLLVFELFEHQTKLTPHIVGDEVYFTLDISMFGNLGEVSCGQYHNTSDPRYLREAEVAFANEVKRNVQYTLNACKDLGVDIGLFKKQLKNHYPDEWEKIKDRWDEIYPEMPIYTSVNVKVRNLGEHK